MYKFCWLLWIGGTILIIASWGEIVTPAIGWIGFGVALTGTLLSSQKIDLRPQSNLSGP
jgi:hypothetical protein